VLHGGAADLEAVAVLLAALGGGVDDQVHGAALDHIQDIGVGLGDAVDPLALNAGLCEGVAGAGGGIDLHAHLLKAPGDADHFGLVLVLHGDDDPAAPLGYLQTGALEGLQEGLGIGLGQTQHLAGGLHLGAQAGVHVGELLEGEHGSLDGEIAGLTVQAGAIAQILQLFAQHDLGGQVDDGHAGHLGDIGDGAGGAGVDLNDIDVVVVEDILGVDQANDVQVLGHVLGVLQDQLTVLLLQVDGGIDRDGVSGVDAGPLHVLHDAGDEDVLPVKHAVHLQLPAHEVFVDEDGVLLNGQVDDPHELLNVPVGVGDLHALAAQDVGRTDQNGVAQLVGRLKGLLGGIDGAAFGAGDGALFQDLVKALPVLGGVHAVGGGAQDPYAHLGQRLGQLDGGLSAELDHSAPGLLQLHDVLHVLGGQRLEVQFICHIEVGGDGLRVVVDDDGLIAHAAEGPHGVDGAVVELDALADADGAGAQHQHLLLAGAVVHRLVFSVIGGIVVGGLGVELGGAGVHHLEGGDDAVPLPQGLHLGLSHAAQGADVAVGEAHLLGALQGVHIGLALTGLQLVLHVDDPLEAVQEPDVHLGDVVDLLGGEAAAQGLGHHEEPLVGDLDQQVLDLVGVQVLQLVQLQRPDVQLQRADGLHQRALEGVGDGHDLAGGLHLGAQGAAGGSELVEGQAGDLQHAVVDGGLEAGGGLAGYRVGDLVQGIAQGHLGGHLGDGVAGGLGGQGGGAGHTGVDLDDRVLIAVGVQGKLHVAAALDLQGGDDVQGGGAEHLELPVGQGLGRSHHDGVAGVDTHRVDVLHGADGDDVAGGVPHDLELDLLPAGDAPLDEHLVDPGQVQAAVRDLPQGDLVIGDAASGAAQGVGGTDDHGIADLIGEGDSVLYGVDHLGGDAGLTDGFHAVLKTLAVLRLVDGGGAGAQKAHAVLLQGAVLIQRHSQI